MFFAEIKPKKNAKKGAARALRLLLAETAGSTTKMCGMKSIRKRRWKIMKPKRETIYNEKRYLERLVISAIAIAAVITAVMLKAILLGEFNLLVGG